MKSVLISIKPKWCELIASGQKTIEVRKTRPSIETPFKCYIYETKGLSSYFIEKNNTRNKGCLSKARVGGKVIGEFVCDWIESVNAQCSDSGIDFFYHDCEQYGCLSQVEVEKYFGVYDEERAKDLRSMKGNGYAWHISDLKIYDKPKELEEFWTRSNHPDCHQCAHVPAGMNAAEFVCHNDFCGECRKLSYKSMWATHFRKRLTRPPQSWCYVEEM